MFLKMSPGRTHSMVPGSIELVDVTKIADGRPNSSFYSLIVDVHSLTTH